MNKEEYLKICDKYKSGIYIMIRPEHVNDKIYKVGMTDSKLNKRHNQYNIGTKVLHFIPCKKAKHIEQLILEILRHSNNIIYRSDIGLEYFQGEYNLIKNILISNCPDFFTIKYDFNLVDFINSVNKYSKGCNENINIQVFEKQKPIAINTDINSKNICKRCNFSFDYKYLLIRHLKKVIECPVKNIDIERSVLIDELKNNSVVQTINDIIKYKCQYCNKLFSSAQSKCNHLKYCKYSKNNNNENILEKQIPIPINIDINNENILEKQKQIPINTDINTNNKNICKRCNFSFSYKYLLLRHLKKDKECAIKNNDIERSILIEELKNNSVVQTINDKIKYKCQYCNKLYNSSQSKCNHLKYCKSKNTIKNSLDNNMDNSINTSNNIIL